MAGDTTSPDIQAIRKIAGLLAKGQQPAQLEGQLVGAGFAAPKVRFFLAAAPLTLDDEQLGTLLEFRGELEAEPEAVPEDEVAKALFEFLPREAIDGACAALRASLPEKFIAAAEAAPTAVDDLAQAYASLGLSDDCSRIIGNLRAAIARRSQPVKRETILNAIADLTEPEKLEQILALFKQEFGHLILDIKQTQRKDTSAREIFAPFLTSDPLYQRALLVQVLNVHDNRLLFFLGYIPTVRNLAPIPRALFNQQVVQSAHHITKLLVEPVRLLWQKVQFIRQEKEFEDRLVTLTKSSFVPALRPQLLQFCRLLRTRKFGPDGSTAELFWDTRFNLALVIEHSFRTWYFHALEVGTQQNEINRYMQRAEEIAVKMIDWAKPKLRDRALSDSQKHLVVLTLALMSEVPCGKAVTAIRQFFTVNFPDLQIPFDNLKTRLHLAGGGR